ncbi:predicted protein [Nematostella vectensis]|uniref:Protein RFT1 homolog n=1 Tax=Nematostella vectensis TaxID=45351 RepID=A7S4E5_NEMVE|nr:protein RFT1 homolog [Nematostella vectensis]EDO41402.1 predicted protein [Nematostella vectensis]|eukprot:XP_001633465.1 predicted protein [Nematostella vectensis]
MADKSIVGSTVRSASYNVALQVTFRILTFFMNGILMRFISRDMLGVVNVRLVLLQQTITFVSREAFRKSCLTKSASGSEQHWPQVINLLWCVFPIGVVTSALLGFVWIYYLEKPDPNIVANYSLAVVIFASTGAIELLSEQLWVISQVFLFFRLKVVIEGIANFVKCVLTVFLVIVFPGLGVMSFCLAQVSFSVLSVGLYYAYFVHQLQTGEASKINDFPLKSMTDCLPAIIPGKAIVSLEMASLTWSFFKQSFLKKILTEGERFIMTLFQALTFAEQGIYDVINNLGSLVARCVFMPIEESYYTFFSHVLSRGKLAKDQPGESAKMAAQALELVLKFAVLVGMTILVFGYAYSYLLLDIYGGSMLSGGEGSSLLRWYCVYVLIIAVNGITECFMFAAMSKQDVDLYNYKMMLFSVIFLFASWYLTIFGSAGFIMANCLNMLLRIAHSIGFIQHFFKETPNLQPLVGLVPSPMVVAAYFASAVITIASEILLCCDHGWGYRILHIAIGAACLFFTGMIVFFKETALKGFVLQQMLGVKKKVE